MDAILGNGSQELPAKKEYFPLTKIDMIQKLNGLASVLIVSGGRWLGRISTVVRIE
jgi:hypothetical protein